jgi:hypothetical protein
MALHRKLDALLRGAQAAHATYSVYGSGPQVLKTTPSERCLTQRHARIARIPNGDVYPGDYEPPRAIEELPARVRRQLAQLGGGVPGSGALDAGNGDVLDAMIGAAVTRAHFELECEQSLRLSATELLIMRNRGDAAALELQLADAVSQLEQAQQRNAQCQELFARGEQPRARQSHKNRTRTKGKGVYDDVWQ